MHSRCGVQLYVDARKLDVLRCVLPEALLDAFTADPAASPVHVVAWGMLGETWPYFRPNWNNMEEYRVQRGAGQVRGGGSDVGAHRAR